ncbi:DUF6053 domain-containing protein [Lysobacter enzymogenes]|uniref:DUF6053 domain-containing protein n=1 Tax=Lysobacter enzymogenes TaxID=69 RepID=UPI00374A75F9
MPDTRSRIPEFRATGSESIGPEGPPTRAHRAIGEAACRGRSFRPDAFRSAAAALPAQPAASGPLRPNTS